MSLRSKIALCSMANVVASLVIFVVGGSFIFANDAWGYLGLASMGYAAVSCILLLFTLASPSRPVLLIDKSGASLLLVFFFAAVLAGKFELLPVIGLAVMFAIKWFSHAYAFQHRTHAKMA